MLALVLPRLRPHGQPTDPHDCIARTGGNHFRAYKQNGTEAHSNAWFLAASKEVVRTTRDRVPEMRLAPAPAANRMVAFTQDIRGNHKVAKNGYNVGRDLIVAKAIKGTSYLGRSWEAEVEWIEGMLEPGNRGALTKGFQSALLRTLLTPDLAICFTGINHGISQDGRVAVLTVTEY